MRLIQQNTAHDQNSNKTGHDQAEHDQAEHDQAEHNTGKKRANQARLNVTVKTALTAVFAVIREQMLKMSVSDDSGTAYTITDNIRITRHDFMALLRTVTQDKRCLAAIAAEVIAFSHSEESPLLCVALGGDTDELLFLEKASAYSCASFDLRLATRVTPDTKISAAVSEAEREALRSALGQGNVAKAVVAGTNLIAELVSLHGCTIDEAVAMLRQKT